MTSAGGKHAAASDEIAATETPGAPAGRRRINVLVAVAIAVFAIDLISKTIVVATLSDHPPVRLLGGFVTLTLLRNGGAAFSIGTQATVLFTAIAVGVIIYIVRVARHLRSAAWAVTLGLLLGGASGNLGDRIFRSPGIFRGHVVDWIEVPHFAVFNFADSCITCGGALVVLLALRRVKLDGTRETDSSE
jgi:signal peptidase II